MKTRDLLLGLCLVALPACSTMKPTPAGQTAAHFDTVIQQKVSLDYLVYLPPGVATEPHKKWPTVIFLHGSGEKGTNVWDVTKHGPPKLVKEGQQFPFIVISPQCPPGKQWETEAVRSLIKKVKALYPVDENRLYLTGLSMGGTGAWNLIVESPGLFAAAVPICGRGDTNAVTFVKGKRLEDLKRLPIWAFHGAKDPTVPVKGSEEMVAALKKLDADVKLTIYPDAVHDSWTQTYANPELYTWLLAHDRKSNGTCDCGQ